jgi:hypothetical protein
VPRESDRNARKFHKGHYEIIAGRFREQMSRYVNDEGELVGHTGDEVRENDAAVHALNELARSLSERFKFDNEDHDTSIFLERCGVVHEREAS